MAKARIYITKSQIFRVIENEDSTLTLIDEKGNKDFNGNSKIGCYSSSSETLESRNAKFLEHTIIVEDYDTFIAEHYEEKKARHIARQEAVKERKREELKQLENERESLSQWVASQEVIEANEENISKVLRFLNLSNWGLWELPKLSIGYSAHQYDCDGKQISTITLDEAIQCRGSLLRKFKSGSKRGHLEKYTLI